MMKCPGCGQDMQPVMRYLGGARWYQFGRAGGFCPKCDSRLVLIWTTRFRFLYLLSVATVVIGIAMLLLSLNRGMYLVERSGAVLLFVGGFIFFLALVNRKFGVAPDSAPKTGG